MKLESYGQAKLIQEKIYKLNREKSTLNMKMKGVYDSEREIGGICLTTDELKILIEKRELALMKLQKEFDEV